MSWVEITSVVPHGEIAGGLDEPRPARFEGFQFPFAGWVAGSPRDRYSILVLDRTEVVRETPAAVVRPDVLAHLGWSEPVPTGFAGMLSAVQLPAGFSVQVVASQGDSRHAVATITGRRGPLPKIDSKLQPLALTGIGRSGTTLFMRVLSAHPEIVALRKHPYEARIAAYWAQALRFLTDGSDPGTYGSDAVVQRPPFGPNPFAMRYFTEGAPHFTRWATKDNVEHTARYCVGAIDAAYAAIALDQQQPRPRYFLEKYLPNFVSSLLMEIYPGGREVFLVRDPRDVVASIIAFNRARVSRWEQPMFAHGDRKQMLDGIAESTRSVLSAFQQRRATAHLLRYEDLVRDPANAIRGVLRHAGLDDSTATISSMIAQSDWPQSAGHRTTADAASSIGRWTSEFTEAELSEFREATEPIMRAFDGS